MAIATNASAQFINGGGYSGLGVDTDNYNRLELGYSPMSIGELDGIGELDLTGVSVGWTKGINLTKSYPLFLEVGVNVMYGFGKHETWQLWMKITSKASLLAINVPVTAAWKFSLAESFSLVPHVGLNLRGNILGKATFGIDYNDEETDNEEVDL